MSTSLFGPARVGVSALVLWATSVAAQRDSLASVYAEGITEAGLRAHLEVLASDGYEGRETGHRGEDMAGDYLVDRFRSFGIPEVPGWQHRGMLDGYRQPFRLEQKDPRASGLSVAGKALRFGEDFVGLNDGSRADRDIRRLWVLDGDASDQAWPEGTEAVLVLAPKSGSVSAFDVLRRATALRERYAGQPEKVVLIVADGFTEVMDRMGHALTTPRMKLAGDKRRNEAGLQLVLVTQEVAATILAHARTNERKVRKQGSKGNVLLDVRMAMTYQPGEEELRGENILAYVEGGENKDEVVVLTAHYDHIGVIDGQVHNGADDDGSGTVALLQIAETLARAKAAGDTLRRSVLVMAVSGEEKGLLGSGHYAEHPVFPLASTVADLNIDMIGRVDSIHAGGGPYIHVIGSDRLSTGLHQVNEEANKAVGLELDYRYNSEDDPNRFYYRSDHYNFARKGIPSVFYFSGVHEDYHGPHDDVEKIRFDLVRKRTQLVFHTVWRLADRPERIVVDRPAR